MTAEPRVPADPDELAPQPTEGVVASSTPDVDGASVPPSFPPKGRSSSTAASSTPILVGPVLDDLTSDDELNPPVADGSRTHRGRHRQPAKLAAIILSVALVAALAGGVYLAVLSVRWSERSAAWEAQARTLGNSVADLTTDLAGVTSDLTNTRDQLTTAQQRITELADEKAQVGDDRETQRILASDIQAVAEAAVEVSTLLSDCVNAQTLVNGYLAAPDSTTPEDLQTATDQMTSICTNATTAYADLQNDLTP